ncbi:hypothetical protein BJ322DRAFT_1062622 [Thelephora terrestris]|uniref:Uncharacterized protein n=1 Tax=Thelephora terrestris TaxID=56493 RepID=A0A9P6HE50_9AGAM|nr:hypothetical protein BJ322DRAFT_1062622 [Thelephora terrestris]
MAAAIGASPRYAEGKKRVRYLHLRYGQTGYALYAVHRTSTTSLPFEGNRIGINACKSYEVLVSFLNSPIAHLFNPYQTVATDHKDYNPRTSKLALEVAKRMKCYIEVLKVDMHHENKVSAWFVRVSKASWQPEIRYRRVLGPRGGSAPDGVNPTPKDKSERISPAENVIDVALLTTYGRCYESAAPRPCWEADMYALFASTNPLPRYFFQDFPLGPSTSSLN